MAGPAGPGLAARDVAEGEEELEPEMLALISAAARQDPVFRTLGPTPQENLVTEVTPSEVLVETGRSRERTAGAASIPAWMFNLAWDELRVRRELSNRTLLDKLRVHQSSAVCAILARLPPVAVVPGSPDRAALEGAAITIDEFCGRLGHLHPTASHTR